MKTFVVTIDQEFKHITHILYAGNDRKTALKKAEVGIEFIERSRASKKDDFITFISDFIKAVEGDSATKDTFTEEEAEGLITVISEYENGECLAFYKLYSSTTDELTTVSYPKMRNNFTYKLLKEHFLTLS